MIDPREPDYLSTPAADDRAVCRFAPRDPLAEPTVSIVTPFFNAGAVFDETVRAVENQTLQQFEWIIVNDASTDREALGRLERMRDIDARIRVIDLPENAGPGAARNAGFNAAKSELVFQLDADDLIEPTALEKLAWIAFSRPEWSFMTSYEVGFDAESYLWKAGFHNPRMFLERCPVGAHTVMVRKQAFLDAGGYDESIRGGMEDWDFWLKCADAGHWGGTFREFLCWYRRRENHADIWHDWDGGDREEAFASRMRDRYPGVFENGVPRPTPIRPGILERLPRGPVVPNSLRKDTKRLLLVIPWMKVGGADKFNLDMLEQLKARGWHTTVVCTLGDIHPWMTEFSKVTPDIWCLDQIGGPAIHAAVLKGLIESREPDVVMISQADEGYTLLPYLRGVCPQPAYIDYSHIEEENWKSGGHPRSGAAMHDLLEMSMVTSDHLKSWMVDRGADAQKTEVVRINVDASHWKPDASLRSTIRKELGIDEDECLITFAGRLCAQKQPDVLAKTLVELDLLSRDSGARWRCVIMGDGPDRAMLTGPLAEAGLLEDRDGEPPRVIMLGECSSERVRELTTACDIVFLPSQWEGIAMVQYEAMSTGVVFVGADVGGQRELATPETCVLLQKAEPGRELEDEPVAYASALHSLSLDSERREAMGAAARARIIESFTLDTMGDRVEELLDVAIERARRSASAWPPARLADELGARAVEARRLEIAADTMHRRNTQLESKIRELEQSLHTIEVKERRQRSQRHQRQQQQARAVAKRQLARIESTSTWKLLTFVKRTPLYSVPARLRWGKNWREKQRASCPVERLNRVRSGRAYRLVRLMHDIESGGAPKHSNGAGNGRANPERTRELVGK